MLNIFFSVVLIGLGVVIVKQNLNSPNGGVNAKGWKVHDYIGAFGAFVAGLALLIHSILEIMKSL